MNEDQKTYIEEEDEIITLSYEEGGSEDFYNLAELDYEGKWYIFLTPVHPNEDFAEDEVLIYEIVENEDGEEEFAAIEDEELLSNLIDLLNEEASNM